MMAEPDEDPGSDAAYLDILMASKDISGILCDPDYHWIGFSYTV